MTESRRAAMRRWNTSAKGKATLHRYRATAKGKACIKRANDKRVVVATRVIYLPTQETRDLAYALIKRRRQAYVAQQRQSRGAETEGVQAG
jgi:hypothetical protein